MRDGHLTGVDSPKTRSQKYDSESTVLGKSTPLEESVSALLPLGKVRTRNKRGRKEKKEKKEKRGRSPASLFMPGGTAPLARHTPLSLSHTHTHTHTLSLSHTFALFFCSLAHTQSHSHSHTLTLTLTHTHAGHRLLRRTHCPQRRGAVNKAPGCGVGASAHPAPWLWRGGYRGPVRVCDSRQRSYQRECTGSRPITEVKRVWARLVLPWVTRRES